MGPTGPRRSSRWPPRSGTIIPARSGVGRERWCSPGDEGPWDNGKRDRTTDEEATMVAASTGVLDELRDLGTEQPSKPYRRHGITSETYGVSYADLNKLRKRIKVDHDLARELWASGVHDARILATMIADPKRADAALIDEWSRGLGNYVEADALSGFVARTDLASARMAEWLESDDEWLGTAGWNLLGQLALHDTTLPDDYFVPYLARIERDLHRSKNRVRYAMNNALIAIGMRGD